MRLGQLASTRLDPSATDATRADRLLDRQRCAALLAGSTYDPQEHEVISDDPRSVEIKVSVNVSYHLG